MYNATCEPIYGRSRLQGRMYHIAFRGPRASKEKTFSNFYVKSKGPRLVNPILLNSFKSTKEQREREQ